MEELSIKNWSTFQHFKDRRPPWIKLHREIMDQRDINTISDRSFRVLVNLWLLASEDKTLSGKLPSVEDISFRLRMDKKEIIKSLQELTPWINNSDINTISNCQQDGLPETEAYKEETETKKKTVKRFAPPTPEEVREYCDERQNTVDPEKFIDFYSSKGWMVGKNKMKDWKASVRTWEKSSGDQSHNPLKIDSPIGGYKQDDF